jgi:dsRNA-specific ribonuclease
VCFSLFLLLVLGYYTAVNLFSRNYFLHWNVDDLEQFSSHAVKNSTIFEAALNIGIPSIIITSDATKWQSAYSRARDANDFKHHPSFELSDKNISDTVEALLGAIYLGYSEIESHLMMVGFLNELKVPFRPSQLLNFVVDLPESNPSWFTARGSCLHDDGYPFQLDKNWLDEIVKIGTVIYLENDVKTILDAGLRKMMDIFISNNASASTINQTKFSEILLFTALFDDSLRDDEDQSLVTSSSVGADSSFARSEDSDNSIKKGEAVGLVRVALFRDTLFVIGNAALMLCLAEECYNRYPSAKEGDLHMLKTWTLSNDVLAYIMVKNGFHKCLFDRHAKTTAKLIQKISEADALGEAIWNHHGGWILAGGAAEYERRSASYGKGMQRKPKYVGLSQGRLIEAQKKLPLELTGDLSFSMKAISGALVLSFGLKQAWEQVLFPVFEELLLISPDEWMNYGTDN